MTSWQQELIDCIMELQRKLKDVELRIGSNQNVKDSYNEASSKVAEAREAINRFASVYNEEYTTICLLPYLDANFQSIRTNNVCIC
jgi:uncharacterized coiled-coil DUF342 family protein